MVPGRVGVPANRLSGFEKFEAPDPAEWTARGYAIINPDSRGAFDSEGNLMYVLWRPYDVTSMMRCAATRC